MRRIFKYKLQVTDSQTIFMPAGAIILCCMIQDEEICIWAEVQDNLEAEPRHITMYGTGNLLGPISDRYIGSVQQHHFVWHVYESDEP